jgi:acyl-CoA thioester hydrolase
MTLEHRLRVYYEDTDAGGIVYYANYLKYIERARTEALLAAGMRQTELRERLGILFAVREVTVSYEAPARLEDELVVRTSIAPPGRSRLDMEQEVWRGETCLARARVTLVCIGREGRATRIPEEVRGALEGLAGGS